MKPCPFCEAELRDSVIKCTRCGRSLVDGGGSEHPGLVDHVTVPMASAGTRGASAGFPPARATPIAPPPAVPPAARVSAPVTPGPAPPPPRPAQDLGSRRALPTQHRRSGRPDLALMLAALAIAGAAFIAWRAVPEPWVRLTITDTSERLDPQLVGTVALRGQAALVGVIGQAVTVGLGVLALAWLLYGFDRGSTIPWFLNPVISIVGATAGVFVAALSSTVWFVWEDALVERARAIRLSADELRALLDQQPKPLVEIERVAGVWQFGGAMTVALAAACIAWWCYRKRS